MKKQNTHVRKQGGTAESKVSMVSEVARLADAGQLDQALHLLNSVNTVSDSERNARGVCLMRMSRIEDAVRTFRVLVLKPGCTWMKPELPVIYRSNFATALLLAGHPNGCLDMLEDIVEQDHPSVIQLRSTLERWSHGLSWWQWFNWKTGIEPNVPVAVDFLPGEFFDRTDATQTTFPPTQPQAQPSTTQAV